MISHVLSATGHHAATSLLSNVEMLWAGLLAGLLVALLMREEIAWLLAVIAIAALGGMHLIGRQLGATFATWLMVIAGAIVVGVMIGRMRGLKHLGLWEFENRRAGVRRVRKF